MTYIQEEWKDIPGFNGRYQASTLGRIKAVGHPRRINHTFVMKPQKRGDHGYLGIGLYNAPANTLKSYFIHLLILLTFVGPRPAKAQGNHINLDKHDNRICNLEYATPAENSNHALRNGARKRSGKGNCLTPDQVREIRSLPSVSSCRAVGEKYGTSHETIRQIRNGQRWKCLDD